MYSFSRSVIDDYEIAKKLINDQQLNLILQALLLSAESIIDDTNQFSQHMFLRLIDNKVKKITRLRK